MFACAALLAQTAAQKTPSGDWRYYGGEAAGTKYSPLDQIDAGNVSKLRIAWRWKADNFGPRIDTNWEVTPLAINGVLYFTAGARRVTVAVDGATGETLWMYRLEEGERGDRAVRQVNRGVAYWSDGKGDDRIIVISPGYQMVALNAKTGVPVAGFGNKGIVELWDGLDRKVQVNEIGSSSPAMIVGDVAVVGAAMLSGAAPKSKTQVPGYVRGYDVRTGKLLWTFHTIPRLGEFGNDTWEKDSWQYTGNTAVWAPISADLELGYVYLPVETPTHDYYGGHRPGDNLFGDSIVCLDAKTGKRVWHYQLIHHDIWDWDTASAPVLLNVNVDGRAIKAVAQVTKQGFTYVFDRVSGQPVWPIVEKPVPQSDVPGEKTSATQPFPTKPAAFERQGISDDDLIDFTPELKAEAKRIASQFVIGPLYTPPIVSGTNGKKGTLVMPHNQGAANWQSAAGDPETGILYVPSATTWWVEALKEAGDASDMRYIIDRVTAEMPMGFPLVRPPWGRVTAIDLNTGEHAWMVPNGHAPQYVQELVKNNPAFKNIDLTNVGQPERAPLLVTKTLLFTGDGSGMFSAGPGGGGPLFRALDKKTGKTLHEMELPGNETGLPMTYLAGGRQFIVVAVAKKGEPAELVALSLPR